MYHFMGYISIIKVVAKNQDIVFMQPLVSPLNIRKKIFGFVYLIGWDFVFIQHLIF
jgi:hypothetical protein